MAAWAVAAVAATVSLASCGSSPTVSSGRSDTTAVRGASSPSSAPTAAVPAYAVTTRSVGSLGTVLVDGSGRTLYMFAPDRGAGRSTCYSSCAVQWPPLLLPKGVTKPVAGGAARASLLGTTRRNDGTLQVTYAGWPLYLFVFDTKAGQASGQAINNLGGYWYVLKPSGAVER